MILNRQRSVRPPMQALRTFLARVRRELRLGKTEFSVCLVSDAEIAEMNRRFRRKRGPTDVLSFPATRRAKAGAGRVSARTTNTDSVPLGDIAIAPAVALRNARTYGRTFPHEMKILILHGVLHLLGYDHEADRGEMDRKEQKLRRRLGLA
jgi:probable rRNA maturation factor